MVDIVRFLLRLHEYTLSLLRFVHFLALSLRKGLKVQAIGRVAVVEDVIQLLTCSARVANSSVFNRGHAGAHGCRVLASVELILVLGRHL